jgi:hypothetical protein
VLLFRGQEVSLEECCWVHDVAGVKPDHTCAVISVAAELMVDIVGVEA